MDTVAPLENVAPSGSPVPARAPASAASRVASPDSAPTGGTRWLTTPVLAAAAAAIGVIFVHLETAASIVSIWIRSETFAHGFVVVPVFLWLVYRKRVALAAATARPWWPGLVAVLAAGALWFVMWTADVLGVAQFALAFMVQAALVTVLGLRVTRILVFPLLFLWFAVPVGEIFVPTLIDWTADFTIAALRVSGVPVYREANHFAIPTGNWSIVEACSGIRYIIASVMIGTIYAAVAYRSPRRRTLFLAASIVTPIVANWLRAYIIVMLGHWSHNQIAAGVDHIIYGWIFFGLVMLLLFWLGSFWSEDDAAVPAHKSKSRWAVAAPPVARTSGAWFAVAAIACVIATGLWTPIEALVVKKGGAEPPKLAHVTPAAGWQALDSPLATWRPYYSGYDWDLVQSYRRDESLVGLYVAYYRDQRKGRELITSGNQLTDIRDPTWKVTDTQPEAVEWMKRTIQADRSRVVGPTQEIDVVPLFWVGGRVTASIYWAKALLAWSRLTGGGDDAALVVVYAVADGGSSAAAATIEQFARDMSAPIERALLTVRSGTQ